jgi:hypothetical protein
MYMLRASFIVLQHAALLSEVVACVESFMVRCRDERRIGGKN